MLDTIDTGLEDLIDSCQSFREMRVLMAALDAHRAMKNALLLIQAKLCNGTLTVRTDPDRPDDTPCLVVEAVTSALFLTKQEIKR